jgi:hypothetical protein
MYSGKHIAYTGIIRLNLAGPTLTGTVLIQYASPLLRTIPNFRSSHLFLLKIINASPWNSSWRTIKIINPSKNKIGPIIPNPKIYTS